MTYSLDHENSPHRDSWDWIGVCNTQAHSVGLNIDPATAPHMDSNTRRLRTRLWWSLYTQDRLIAMVLRRPTRVNEGTCSVAMLKLEDFDFEPFHPSVLALFHCHQLEDISHQKCLATMFIEKVKLSQCVDRVLSTQYTPSHGNLETNSPTVTLAPRQPLESELAQCSQKVDSWASGLPKAAQFFPGSRNTFEDGEDVLLFHSAMLKILYHAIISALYRPWATGSTRAQAKSQLELANTARANMRDAGSGITHVLHALDQFNLTRFLPQTGMAVILSAAVADTSPSPGPLAAGFDPLTEYPDGCFSDPGYPEVYPDQTEGLLTDSNTDTSLGMDRKRGPLFLEEGWLDAPNSGITGDLDKDLGFGDDFY